MHANTPCEQNIRKNIYQVTEIALKGSMIIIIKDIETWFRNTNAMIFADSALDVTQKNESMDSILLIYFVTEIYASDGKSSTCSLRVLTNSSCIISRSFQYTFADRRNILIPDKIMFKLKKDNFTVLP